MHQARRQLWALVRRLRARSESIVIALAGKLPPKLVLGTGPAPRQLGADRRLIAIAPNFEAVDADIAKLFEGG